MANNFCVENHAPTLVGIVDENKKEKKVIIDESIGWWKY